MSTGTQRLRGLTPTQREEIAGRLARFKRRSKVIVPFDPKTLERISKNRARGCVECTSLPKHFPGADSYTPSGAPQYETLGRLQEAGKRAGLSMR